jgi:serine phosphatase RsbU (regulator of sigma subunit)
MKLPFHHKSEKPQLRMPAPPSIPQLEGASLAALYRAARTGGDFFDFQSIRGRLIFLLLDIAGRRDQALDIAAAVQDQFHLQVPEVFGGSLVNEADALSQITVELNRTIMEAAKGVRCAPAFLGSYDEDVGIAFYINAGHTPGLLRDTDGVQLLAANGLPLGLFSHATHDAQTVVLGPGAALLVVSKGLVESRRGRQEFGMERLQQSVDKLAFKSANELCSAVLTAVQEFTKNTPGQNDITAVALMRAAVAAETELASAATVR